MRLTGRTTIDAERSERFERLYRASAAAVYAYARRRAAPDMAEDVVADTFAVAWRRLESVPEPPVPWLLGTARRVLANRVRSEQRHERLLRRLHALESPGSPSEAEPASVSVAMVLEALDRLSAREREAVMLVAWDGLDGAAAAAAAGCTRTAFSVRLHRARRHLRKQLGPSAQMTDQGRPPAVSPAHEGPRT